MSEQQREQGRGDEVEHLRGIRGRGAEDTGQGHPRPDEPAAGEPPAIQATHAGVPTDDPLVEPLDDSGAGSVASITGNRDPHGRGRGHRKNPDNVEGAFGEEGPPGR